MTDDEEDARYDLLREVVDRFQGELIHASSGPCPPVLSLAVPRHNPHAMMLRPFGLVSSSRDALHEPVAEGWWRNLSHLYRVETTDSPVLRLRSWRDVQVFRREYNPRMGDYQVHWPIVMRHYNGIVLEDNDEVSSLNCLSMYGEGWQSCTAVHWRGEVQLTPLWNINQR